MPLLKLVKTKKGFTLIELLTVITIISIMIAVGVTSWTNAKVRSRDTKRKADLKSVQQALELFFQANGHYPPYNVGICLTYDVECTGYCQYFVSSAYPEFRNQIVPTYLSKIPLDPSWSGEGPFNYIYVKTAPGKYEIYAYLENASDPDRSATPYSIGGWCGGWAPGYNYKITQP